jgi:hypothetical protein
MAGVLQGHGIGLEPGGSGGAMTSFFRKLRWWMRRPGKEAELQEELQFHLEEEAGERQAEGLAAEEARRAARRELGNVALVQEDTRATWTWTFAEQLAQDMRYGLRTIAANKTFSAMAILSLALGIGAKAPITLLFPGTR